MHRVRVFLSAPVTYPTFLSGFARVLDLGATLDRDVGHHVLRSDPWQTDRNASADDWRTVGNDLRAAMNSVP